MLQNLTEPVKRPFRISDHVHSCQVGPHVVLLDVRADRYQGFPASDGPLLHRWIENWPPPKPETSMLQEAELEKGTAGNEEHLIRELLDQGLITENSTLRDRRNDSRNEKPEVALIEGYLDLELNINARDAIRFLLATSTAAALLRWSNLERIVRHARSIKLLNARNDMAVNRLQLQRCVGVFTRLRPLLFTAQNHCLFDSFALYEFLGRYGITTQWVFGVKRGPFAAHCWLQRERLVINDDPEAVQRFTPIMTI